ncbi:MAG: hypothetical protein J7500_12680 [Sphingomonas sp.]|uniref:hypothetical protein n=1 Tax=Sphingomonas sp. TaxID=28214 RepID=UPI001B0E40D7|nr:hypothetical protein [Sphingomonas sp.]MBO9623557.1 hypothetical protein [Sphingomonas sp.]
MPRDYDDAVWADHHQHVSSGLAKLFDDIAGAFRRLNAIEYDAPWQKEAERACDTLAYRHHPEDPSIGRAATFR